MPELPRITTRLATPEDHGAIADLINRAFAEENAGAGAPHLETEQSISEHTKFGMAVYIVAVLNGELVGCVQVNRGGRISFLAVDPPMRRQGLGWQLTAEAEDYARKDGCESVSVSVLAEQEDLLRRYRDWGFVDTGTRDRAGTQEKIIMRKALSDRPGDKA